MTQEKAGGTISCVRKTKIQTEIRTHETTAWMVISNNFGLALNVNFMSPNLIKVSDMHTLVDSYRLNIFIWSDQVYENKY